MQQKSRAERLWHQATLHLAAMADSTLKVKVRMPSRRTSFGTKRLTIQLGGGHVLKPYLRVLNRSPPHDLPPCLVLTDAIASVFDPRSSVPPRRGWDVGRVAVSSGCSQRPWRSADRSARQSHKASWPSSSLICVYTHAVAHARGGRRQFSSLKNHGSSLQRLRS